MANRLIEVTLALKDLFTGKLGKVKSGLQGVEKQATKTTSTFTKLGGKIAGLFTVSALTAGIAGLKRYTDRLDDLAKSAGRIGIATEELSKLQFAAELTGTSADVLENGLFRLNRTVGQAAEGNERAARAFRDLGLSAEELADLTVEQQFSAVADALNRVENESDKARIGYEIFGRQAKDLNNLLAEGSKGLKNYGDRLQEMGGVITDEAASAAEELNDRLTDLNANIEAFVNRYGPGFIDVINRAFQGIGIGVGQGRIADIKDEIALLNIEIARLQETSNRQAGGLLGTLFGADENPLIEEYKNKIAELHTELITLETDINRNAVEDGIKGIGDAAKEGAEGLEDFSDASGRIGSNLTAAASALQELGVNIDDITGQLSDKTEKLIANFATVVFDAETGAKAINAAFAAALEQANSLAALEGIYTAFSVAVEDGRISTAEAERATAQYNARLRELGEVSKDGAAKMLTLRERILGAKDSMAQLSIEIQNAANLNALAELAEQTRKLYEENLISAEAYKQALGEISQKYQEWLFASSTTADGVKQDLAEVTEAAREATDEIVGMTNAVDTLQGRATRDVSISWEQIYERFGTNLRLLTENLARSGVEVQQTVENYRQWLIANGLLEEGSGSSSAGLLNLFSSKDAADTTANLAQVTEELIRLKRAGRDTSTAIAAVAGDAFVSATDEANELKNTLDTLTRTPYALNVNLKVNSLDARTNVQSLIDGLNALARSIPT